MVCKNCSRIIPKGQQTCPHCEGAVRKNGRHAVNARTYHLGMGFYNYLIYFGFFASAVINFAVGYFAMECDNLLGIYASTYACFVIVVRFLMAKRKKIGVNIYLGMLAVDGILTAISAYSILDDFSDNTEAMLMQYGLNHLFEVSANDLKMMYLLIMIFGYALAAMLVGITFKIFAYFLDRRDFFDR